MDGTGVRGRCSGGAVVVMLTALAGCAVLPGAGMPFPDEIEQVSPAAETPDAERAPVTPELPAQAAGAPPIVPSPAVPPPEMPETPPSRPASQPTSPPLPPLEPLVVTQIDATEPTPALDEPISSLLLPEPLPVADLLRRLLRDTELSLALDPGIDATFTGELKGVSLRRALDIVLQPFALDYRIEQRVLRVSRRPLLTRVFELNLGASHRVSTRRVSAGTGEHEPGSVLVSTDDRNRSAELERAVGGLLSPLGRAHLDRGVGLLRVTDRPESVDAVARYLERVVERAARQVRIDARVVEVAFFEDDTTGLDWRRLRGASPSSLASSPVLAGPADVERFLAALTEQGRVTLLSRPIAMTLHNEPVLIRVGGAADTVVNGVTLAMTPQVGFDGLVTLSVTPRVTTVTDDPGVVDAFTVREADTLLRLRDGETAILGGWFRRLSSPLPSAGSRPRPVATDLVILLTPTVVECSGAFAAGC